MLKQLFAQHWPKAVFFDLDGTLVDSIPGLASAVDLSLQAMGLPTAGEEKVRLWVGNGSPLLVQRALSFAKQCPSDAISASDYQAAHQFFFHYYAQTAQQGRLFAGVKETLTVLQQAGVRMALITNKPKQFLPDLLDKLELAQFFEHTLGGDSLAQCKPSPEPLLHMLKLMRLTADECVMVGDSANDIEAARAAGMRSICVSYGYNYGQDVRLLPATAHIDCFSQLLA